MSESIQEFEQPEAAQGVASAGGMLAAARDSAGLSVEEVATKLRLSVRQVQALEADDASGLPDAMYVRGFIRNYAKLLGLDAETLLAAYRVSAPDAESHAISLHSENIPIVSYEKKTWLPYALASAIVGLALGGWMIYMEFAVENRHPVVAEKTVAEKPITEKTVTPVAVAPQPVAPMLSMPPQVPLATPPAQEMKPTEPVAIPVQTLSAARLAMTFTEQSWVSVADRDGKEIFNKSQPAGSQATIEGVPPFNIVIGNATGVQLSFNDKPVDLAPHAKANVARLTLE